MKKVGINSIRRLIRLILGLLPNEMNKANAQKMRLSLNYFIIVKRRQKGLDINGNIK